MLQQVLGEFELVPLIVGQVGIESVVSILESLWGGPETLVVVSTDLSHYLNEDQARAADAATLQRCLDLDPRLDPGAACGAFSLGPLLAVAAEHRMGVELLANATSADAGGPEDRVVGYAAMAFTEWAAVEPGSPEARELLDAARRAVIDAARGRLPVPVGSGPLVLGPGASFVTLRKHGELRGCIGTLHPNQDLAGDVVVNAAKAATVDPRFEPVSVAELDDLELEISVLTPPSDIGANDMTELAGRIRPGIDGLVVEAGQRRATLLPAVWDQLGDTGQFLAALWAKAGLRAGEWPAGLRVRRYEAVELA